MPRYSIFVVDAQVGGFGPESKAIFSDPVESVDAPDPVAAVLESVGGASLSPADSVIQLQTNEEPYYAAAVVNEDVAETGSQEITLVHLHTDGEEYSAHVAPVFGELAQAN